MKILENHPLGFNFWLFKMNIHITTILIYFLFFELLYNNCFLRSNYTIILRLFRILIINN